MSENELSSLDEDQKDTLLFKLEELVRWYLEACGIELLDDDRFWDLLGEEADVSLDIMSLIDKEIDIEDLKRKIAALPPLDPEAVRKEKMAGERLLARDLGMKVADYRALSSEERCEVLSIGKK